MIRARVMRQHWANAWAIGFGLGKWEFWMELSHKAEDFSRNWKDYSFSWADEDFKPGPNIRVETADPDKDVPFPPDEEPNESSDRTSDDR